MYLDEIAQYCSTNPEAAVGFCALMKEQWNAFMMEVQGVLGDIMQIYGYGDIWKKADMVAHDIRQVVSLVEEVHMQEMSSVNDIADWCSSDIFSYQICAEVAKEVISSNHILCTYVSNPIQSKLILCTYLNDPTYLPVCIADVD